MWARTAFSIALTALSALALSQAFGRFGYVRVPHVAGLKLDPAFFSTDADAADKLMFERPADLWGSVATSDVEQTIAFGKGDLAPAKLRITLTTPGFAMYCPTGLKLHLSSVSSPFLTWAEGSVEGGVPTPSLKWAVLSFATKQPPVIFGFPDKPCSMRIDGKAGDWTISFTPLAGWVRVGALLGDRSVAANTAYTLGQLADQAVKQGDLYSTMPPKLSNLSVEGDLESVTATWHYDHAGAIVPNGALLAKLGGYPLAIQSPYRTLEFQSKDGPLAVLTGLDLKIRFPIQRIPTGRGVGLGPCPDEPLANAAPNDVASVVELALENLGAGRSHSCKVNGQETYDEFFNEAEYAVEPCTGQQLPYAISGKGIDLCAAHALLNQAITNATKAGSDQNSLLTSIDWRRDWLSWRLCVDDPAVGRRAAALAALAGAMCPEPARRLDAAMLQAGLAADRGLNLWLSHRDPTVKVVPMLESEFGLRQALFGLSGPPARGHAFVDEILSPIRIYGDVSLSASLEADKLKISWPVVDAKPSMLNLASGFPVDLLRGGNFAQFKVGQSFGLTELRYIPEFSGDCWAYLTCPRWVKKLPSAAEIPLYAEELR